VAEYDTPLLGVVGDRTAKKLEGSFGLRTVEDALRNYPRRYLRRGQLTALSDLRLGDEVTVIADIASISTTPLRQRAGRRGARFKTDVVISDGSSRLSLVFFNKSWMQSKLRVGSRAMFAGTVGEYRGRRQLVNPDVQQLPAQWVDDEAAASAALAAFGSILPVYRGSTTVRSWVVTRSMSQVLAIVDDLADPIPEDVRRSAGLLGFGDAMRAIHAPADEQELAAARRRFKFEEAFVLQIELLRRRAARRARHAVPRAPSAGGLRAALEQRLPFALTPGQRAVSDEIAADMAEAHPMLRLLQGDVGSGKTVVALRAMLATVDAGAQAALLAPTEVLAQQHYATILDLLGPLARRGQLAGDTNGTAAVLLTGSLGAQARREALLAAASGDAGIVVGTHALMGEGVQFADLGLVVVDEQHRFGVEQRAALSEQSGGSSPHMLVMTATPIPRTIAMTVFGDVDVSTLTERPAGRAPVTTHLVPGVARPGFLARTWERVREEVDAGHKVYVVCPRITSGEDSDTGGTGASQLDDGVVKGTEYPPSAAEDLLDFLREGPLAGLRVGLLHGRLSAADKESAMAAFAAPADDPAAMDVLVATTVIEVGVDVPAATLMVIVDADRFGVSSLHQLRGRVGRGDAPGLCLLLTAADPGSPAAERLSAVAATTDGFALSEIDLRARREGDVLGVSQSGRANSLRLLSVLDDADVIEQARDAAERLLAADPELRGAPAVGAALARLARSSSPDYLEKA